MIMASIKDGFARHPTSQHYAKLQASEPLGLLPSSAWIDVTDGQVKITTEIPGESISTSGLVVPLQRHSPQPYTGREEA